MLGDSAVAINSRDERYLSLHGKSVMLPLMNREIPIICDDLADPEFGTGVVKVTPAHDPNDYQAGIRNALPMINLLNPDGTYNENAGKYAGLDRLIVRKRIVADLEEVNEIRGDQLSPGTEIRDPRGRGSQGLRRTIHTHVPNPGPVTEQATGGLGIATGEVEKTDGNVAVKMFLDQLPKRLADHAVPQVVGFEDRAIHGPVCRE